MQDKENNQPGKSEFAVIILAGGRSSRMNYPKPWLKYNDSANFTEAIIDKYNSAGIEEKVLVINADFCSSVYVNQINRIKDKVNFAYILEPERGRLFSLAMGLRHIRQAKYVFIQNVDAPFLQTSTLLEMIKSAEPETTILPRFKTSNGHPVLADAEMLRNLLKNADESSSLKQLISGCKRKIVETDDNGILINVNTPNEYDKVMHEYMA